MEKELYGRVAVTDRNGRELEHHPLHAATHEAALAGRRALYHELSARFREIYLFTDWRDMSRAR